MTHLETSQIQALIYCGPSPRHQKNPHACVEAQEARCRAYAKARGYQIVEVFSDKTIAGDILEQPGIAALLSHLEQEPKVQHVVIVDEPGRIGRGVTDLIAFRTQLADRDIQLECLVAGQLAPPEAELVDHILAARGEWEDKRREREDV